MKLEDIDTEDIEDVIGKMGRSFNIEFLPNELKGTKTFGELCDRIMAKIDLESRDDCTSQQAFYKLRDAFGQISGGNKDITLDNELAVLFPWKNRRRKIKELEKHLGFRIEVLRPSFFVSGLIVLLFIGSIIYLFIDWKVGLLGLSIFFIFSFMAPTFGKRFKVKSLGQLVDKMSEENYLDSRRDINAINKQEAIEKIRALFIRELDLTELGPSSKL